MTTASEPLTVSVDELSELLGVSSKYVRIMNETGRLPRPIRFGKLLKWSVSEIETWLANGAPPRREWDRTRERLTN